MPNSRSNVFDSCEISLFGFISLSSASRKSRYNHCRYLIVHMYLAESNCYVLCYYMFIIISRSIISSLPNQYRSSTCVFTIGLSMATFEFFIIIFFFFLPQIAANKCHESRCTMSYDTPLVRFPFRLRNYQPSRCGYSANFDLSCNEQKQTILTLPSSSGALTVERIYYTEQILQINDQNKCILKRFLDNDLSLVGSPFQFEHDLENYTFFQCSPKAPILLDFLPITCLSNDNYKVIALFSRFAGQPPSNCTVISTAMVPFQSYDQWQSSYFDVSLTWGVPDCRSCESFGRVCGLKKASTSKLDCSSPKSGTMIFA